MEFRPCIDIHNGKVKQIVGGSLKDEGSKAAENFVSGQDAGDLLRYKFLEPDPDRENGKHRPGGTAGGIGNRGCCCDHVSGIRNLNHTAGSASPKIFYGGASLR